MISDKERSKLFRKWGLSPAEARGAVQFQAYAIETGRIEFHVTKPGVIVFQTDEGYEHPENEGDTLHFEATLGELVLDAVDGLTQSRCYILKCAEEFEKAAAQLRELAEHPDQVEYEDDHNEH